jgi:putative OPT family oligopeptide transporter
MTMLTLIVTGMVMLWLGLDGGTGMFVTMMVGGVVCTALAASGALASDLKIGHWLGATPARQLALKFLGTLVAAIFCGVAMWVMAQAPVEEGFGTDAIPAPQASAMKEILVGIFADPSDLRWYLFWLGVVVALILRMANIPALAFALGMYLPMELNTPVLLGGILSWMVSRRKEGETDGLVKARKDKGILLASGFVAGGALAGVFVAIISAIVMRTTGSTEGMKSLHLLSEHAFEGKTGEFLALVALAALCVFMVTYSRRARAET